MKGTSLSNCLIDLLKIDKSKKGNPQSALCELLPDLIWIRLDKSFGLDTARERHLKNIKKPRFVHTYIPRPTI